MHALTSAAPSLEDLERFEQMHTGAREKVRELQNEHARVLEQLAALEAENRRLTQLDKERGARFVCPRAIAKSRVQ